MKKMKRVLAGILTLAMLGSFAACSDNKTPDTTTTAATTTAAGDTTTAAGGDKTDATTTAAQADAKYELSKDPVTIKISWWGGESRHTATQAAIDKFEEANKNITVDVEFAAWDGWEEKMSTAFFAGTAPDVNQINWNWIQSFSADGSKFLDMNTVSNFFDLKNYSDSALGQCTLANELQAIPVAMTGRIFYWNEAAFTKAGISTPKSLADLLAAGETFKTKLGDDYYPLAMGEYDRMILMVYYLESVYGKAWVVDGKLNYTAEEIQKGLEFIDSLEDAHVIPTVATILGDGATSLDKNPKWIEGKYAGIFEWDSSASKFGKALAEGNKMIVGEYFKDFGEYQGGYSKVSLCFAISESTKYPAECALLLNYLLNEDEGTAIMASERGIPLSAAALANLTKLGKEAEDKGEKNTFLDATVAEANKKVLAWVNYPLDPKFEDSKLKGNPDGVYYDVMSGLSYNEYTAADAAKALIEGVNKVLNG